jgi:hypothetical protein
MVFGSTSTVSHTWLALKDAGWLGVAALICIGTVAVSTVANRRPRITRKKSPPRNS